MGWALSEPVLWFFGRCPDQREFFPASSGRVPDGEARVRTFKYRTGNDQRLHLTVPVKQPSTKSEMQGRNRARGAAQQGRGQQNTEAALHGQLAIQVEEKKLRKLDDQLVEAKAVLRELQQQERDGDVEASSLVQNKTREIRRLNELHSDQESAFRRVKGGGGPAQGLPAASQVDLHSNKANFGGGLAGQGPTIHSRNTFSLNVRA